MEMAELTINIELVYIKPESQNVLKLKVAKGTTIQQALESSGLLEQFPEIDLSANKVGIYSKIKPLDTVLEADDQVEIYRPLLADPKEARRRRASKKAK
jgi:putative ubiquitin-RnfH superfamily antitoxin RatB of RatAB toxin-antitoxin module